MEPHVEINRTLDYRISQRRIYTIPAYSRLQRNVLIGPRLKNFAGAVASARSFPITTGILRTQPKRITEIHRIPRRVPIQVEPAREADGVFLGEAPVPPPVLRL